MRTKRTVPILLILSIIPILQGFDNSASIIYRHLLMQEGSLNMYFQLFNLSSFLALSIGLLIGGLAIDKWNYKKLVLIDLIGLSIISLFLQFNDSYVFVIIQRFVLGFSFGFLMLSFKVYLTEIAEPKHRGKVLYAFLNISIIGTLIYQFIFSYFEINFLDTNLSYAHFQIPFIILPLLVLSIIHHLPDSQSSESNKSYTIRYFFKQNQRNLLLVMFVMAILLSFTNTGLITSQISMDAKNEYMHIIPMLIWLLAAILGISTIDYLGRKRLLKFGINILMFLAVSNIVIPFVTDNQMITLGFNYLYSFFVIYAITTTATIIILEYIPAQVRGRGMIIFAFICWLPSTINNTFIYPSIFNSENKITIVYVISLIVLITSIFLIRRRLIETKGLSLKENKNKIDLK